MRDRHPELDFAVQVEPDLPPFNADVGAMVDAVGNLLNNALKYGGTPPVVRLARPPRAPGHRHRGERQRRRHPARRAPPHLLEVLPHRRPPLARARGQRAGPRHREAHRARAPRPGAGREREGPGDDVPHRPAARSARRRGEGRRGAGQARRDRDDERGRPTAPKRRVLVVEDDSSIALGLAHQPRERGLRGPVRGGRGGRPDDGSREPARIS